MWNCVFIKFDRGSSLPIRDYQTTIIQGHSYIEEVIETFCDWKPSNNCSLFPLINPVLRSIDWQNTRPFQQDPKLNNYMLHSYSKLQRVAKFIFLIESLLSDKYYAKCWDYSTEKNRYYPRFLGAKISGK